MSFSGGYVVPNGGSFDDEREQKRRKVSPTPGANTFKQPAVPNRPQQDEAKMDINDLSDLMTSSGVDLRGEEDFLTSSFQRRQNAQSRPSQQHPHAQGQAQSSARSNFDLLSQNQRFPSIGQHHGTLNQSAASQQTPEEELDEKHSKAARHLAESQQYHLNSPFLYGNSMRYRMERIATENSIKVPMAGLFDKIAPKPDPQAIQGTATSNDNAAIIAAKAPSILNKNSPLDPILSLLSLAADERLRGLVEDAYSLARGRHTTSDGQIPPEWQDIAQPSETVQDVNHSINGRLHSVTAAERKAEEARMKKRAERAAQRKREARNAEAMATEGGTGTNPDGTPTANGATPGGSLGEIAPEVPKTKKEADRLKKAEYANEEVQTRNANVAASMALGGGGKKYSWMQGGSKKAAAARPSIGTPGPATPTSTSGRSPSKPDAAAKTTDKNGLPLPSQDRRYGEWREDGEMGSNIQLRDWVAVLERDGKDKRTLSFALTKLGREQVLD